MSSTSGNLSFAPTPLLTELPDSDRGMLSAADGGVGRPNDALGLVRIVEAGGMSSGGKLDFLQTG